MTVHVGEITSEVTAARSPGAADATGGDEWEERVRLAALMEQEARDRARTATGYGDD
jgi:hypothetical protein